jgi:CRP/FNR family cyclic AMP-dependent transcriptional regulator
LGEETEDAILWRDGGFRALVGQGVWDELCSLGSVGRMEAGAVIMRQGDPGRDVVLLTQGLVKVTRLAIDGTEMLLAVRGPGELLGEMSVLDHSIRSATVSAMSSTTMHRVSGASFLQVVDTRGLGIHLARLAARRQRQNEQLRMDLATLPVPQRVIRLLRQLAEAARAAEPEPQPGVELSDRAVLTITQHEMAGAIGASRSMLAEELKDLRERDIIETGHGQLTVLSIRRLRALDRRRRPTV